MSAFEPLSFKVADTIDAYRIVIIGANANQVLASDTITTAPFGVTVDEQKNSGGGVVPVAVAGIAKVYFNGSCTVGGLVAADASGRGIAASGVTLTSTYVVGNLIGPTVATTGTIADVLINPHAKYGQF